MNKINWVEYDSEKSFKSQIYLLDDNGLNTNSSIVYKIRPTSRGYYCCSIQMLLKKEIGFSYSELFSTEVTANNSEEAKVRAAILLNKECSQLLNAIAHATGLSIAPLVEQKSNPAKNFISLEDGELNYIDSK